MACSCKSSHRANTNNMIIKRTPIRHSATGKNSNGMKRIIRRELL